MSDLDNQVIIEIKKISSMILFFLTQNMNNTQKIEFMNKHGYQTKDIAEFVGTSQNSVRAIVSQLKKRVTKNDESTSPE